MVPTLTPVVTRLATTTLQLPAAFDSTAGQVFLALVAFLVVVFVGRFVLSVAWKIALIAAVAVGAFLLVTTFLA